MDLPRSSVAWRYLHLNNAHKNAAAELMPFRQTRQELKQVVDVVSPSAQEILRALGIHLSQSGASYN
jgi:hypothetical protein